VKKKIGEGKNSEKDYNMDDKKDEVTSNDNMIPDIYNDNH